MVLFDLTDTRGIIRIGRQADMRPGGSLSDDWQWLKAEFEAGWPGPHAGRTPFPRSRYEYPPPYLRLSFLASQTRS